jgi:hypothetical protein
MRDDMKALRDFVLQEYGDVERQRGPPIGSLGNPLNNSVLAYRGVLEKIYTLRPDLAPEVGVEERMR